MSVLSRARLASLSVLLLAGTALVQGASPAVAADPVTSFLQPQTVTFNDDGLFYQTPDEEAIDVPASGSATPYPSQLAVDHPGPVVDVNVSLMLSHTRPDDLDLLLVGPQGQAVVLMSDAGGANAVEDLTIDFDDDFNQAMPDDDALDGTEPAFEPTDYDDGVDSFPAPAPAPNATALSAFDGSSAAGTWSLYAVDDSDDESGTILWWKLEIAVASTAYPSELQVSGIGPVTDVDVSLLGFDTQFASDISFLLVGPRGQQALLLDDAGGGSDEAVTGKNLRFDDEAPFQAPEDDPLESTSYQPTSYEDDPVFPPPAPAPPGSQGPPTSLGVFDGTDPNGTWRLFGFDEEGQDFTTIHGWSLHIQWDDAAAPTGTVAVEGGAARTRDQSVELDLTATDSQPGTGVTEMRLSNDGASYGSWVPYAATTPWQLASGDGVKSVFVQLRDGSGNVSEALRDTIVLDTKAPRGKKASPEDSARHVDPGAKLKVWASEASRRRPSRPRR